MLEPVMKVEVRTPDQFFGDVLGDINEAQMVQDVETFGTLQTIRGRYHWQKRLATRRSCVQ